MLKNFFQKGAGNQQSRWVDKIMKTVKIKKPVMLYRATMLMTASAGIIIAFISFVGAVKIIRNLAKGNAYVGNTPYLAAAVTTLILCIAILTWKFMTLFSVISKTVYKHNGDWEFESYDNVGNALKKNEVPSYKKFVSKMIYDKDFTFIKFFLSAMGTVILFWLAKNSIPDEFYWNLRLTPGYFTPPLGFISIFAAIAGLRTISFILHTRKKIEDNSISETKERIKGIYDPYMLASNIEEELRGIRYDGNANIVFRSGFTATEGIDIKTGRIKRELFIETYPRPVPYETYPIVYIYLLCAAVFSVTGILLMTKLPPDNISVLTVPTIAIGYLGDIVKGGILLFSGWDMMKSVSGIYKTHWFESVMAFVQIEGVYQKEDHGGKSVGTAGNAVRGDCRVYIYTTKLLTEIYDDMEKKHKSNGTVKKGSQKNRDSVTNPGVEEIRHIIKMTEDNHSDEARKLVIAAVKKVESSEGKE